MKWVLIVFAFSWNGVTIEQIPFETEALCKTAMTHMETQVPKISIVKPRVAGKWEMSPHQIQAVCVQVGNVEFGIEEPLGPKDRGYD